MLKTTQILVRPIVLVACVLNMVGCGQTGALYLPAQDVTNPPKSKAPVKAAEPANPEVDLPNQSR